MSGPYVLTMLFSPKQAWVSGDGQVMEFATIKEAREYRRAYGAGVDPKKHDTFRACLVMDKVRWLVEYGP